mgnify:CR=1 FL=1
MASAWGNSWGAAWGNSWGQRSVAAVVDTHDGDREHDKRRKRRDQDFKEAMERLRAEIERLVEGRPLDIEVIEETIAALPEPLEVYSPERIAQMVRALEDFQQEQEDEEIVLMAVQ